MTDRGWMEPIVQRVVTQVLEDHATQGRSEIVRRVMEEVAAQPAPEAAPAGTSSADLARAVAEIQLGISQKEILKALLDSCARYAARVALFVVRGGNATGWQGRGFSSNDAVKDFTLEVNAPAVVRAIADRVIVSAPAADLDARFVQDFGAPAGEGRFLPLVLKDKVAALVYADGGTDGAGQLDTGSLELLVLSTSAWLEVSSLRKQVHKEPGAGPSEIRPAATAEAAPSHSDPFAAHSPGYAMAAAASAEVSAPAPVMTGVTESEPAVVEELVPAVQTAVVEPESPPPPAVSPEEQETHRKAQRFARLLVDEVKLYNQAKVSEGRKNRDLYDRLKEAIEKSRSTYQKRYGNTVAASGNYFQHELVRSLAEDDVSIMGANFRH
ncbi:MAG: hypothetical protein HY233_00125 [Acidobacteriales bacterium]|nr:hypothetical protein [Candidatus Koribacter versatilis]MBI3644365.1 hypothetical protein [Terriglobales bacterium]